MKFTDHWIPLTGHAWLVVRYTCLYIVRAAYLLRLRVLSVICLHGPAQNFELDYPDYPSLICFR